MQSFNDIQSSIVYRVTLWILSEYALEPAILDLAINTIKNAVGPLPLLETKKSDAELEQDATYGKHHRDANQKNRVLADGTYASQAAAADDKAVVGSKTAAKTNLRSLV